MILTAGWALLLGIVLPQAEPDLGAQVRQAVERLKEDDPGLRQRAARSLAELGAGALPLLEPYLKADSLELRGQIRGVMERIYETDPLYLVRRPERSVSLTLKDASLPRALDELFRPFNLLPTVERIVFLQGPEKESVTLKLEGASFWEACQAFAKASGTEIDFESLDELTFRRPSKTERPVFFSRNGYLLVGDASRDEGKVRLRIRGYPEPGWLLPTATLAIDSIEGSDGKNYQAAFLSAQKNALLPETGSNWTSFTPISRSANARDIPAGVSLSIRGSLRVELPVQVEALVIRPQDLKLPLATTISGSRITLKELRVGEKGYAFSLEQEGPKDWKAPPGKSFLEGFRIILADDHGPLFSPGACSYAGKGSMSMSSGWPGGRHFSKLPTRFCLVRVLNVEPVTLPFEIQGLEPSASEDK